MKQTYSCKIVGLSAETLGDLLDAINKVNRGRFGDAPKIGEPVVTAHKSRRTSFNVALVSCGPDKVQTIKAVREITGLGLREAKDLVEMVLPAHVIGDKSIAEARAIVKRLEEAGASAKVV